MRYKRQRTKYKYKHPIKILYSKLALSSLKLNIFSVNKTRAPFNNKSWEKNFRQNTFFTLSLSKIRKLDINNDVKFSRINSGSGLVFYLNFNLPLITIMRSHLKEYMQSVTTLVVCCICLVCPRRFLFISIWYKV